MRTQIDYQSSSWWNFQVKTGRNSDTLPDRNWGILPLNIGSPWKLCNILIAVKLRQHCRGYSYDDMCDTFCGSFWMLDARCTAWAVFASHFSVPSDFFCSKVLSRRLVLLRAYESMDDNVFMCPTGSYGIEIVNRILFEISCAWADWMVLRRRLAWRRTRNQNWPQKSPSTD